MQHAIQRLGLLDAKSLHRPRLKPLAELNVAQLIVSTLTNKSLDMSPNIEVPGPKLVQK